MRYSENPFPHKVSRDAELIFGREVIVIIRNVSGSGYHWGPNGWSFRGQLKRGLWEFGEAPDACLLVGGWNSHWEMNPAEAQVGIKELFRMVKQA